MGWDGQGGLAGSECRHGDAPGGGVAITPVWDGKGGQLNDRRRKTWPRWVHKGDLLPASSTALLQSGNCRIF